MGMGKAAEWGHARSCQQSPWDPQLQEGLSGRSRGHGWRRATTASSGSREGGTEEQSCRPLQDAQWTLEVGDGLTQPLEAMLSKDRAGQRRGECSRATGPSPHLQQRGHPRQALLRGREAQREKECPDVTQCRSPALVLTSQRDDNTHVSTLLCPNTCDGINSSFSLCSPVRARHSPKNPFI